MKRKYDLASAKPNSSVKKERKQISIRIDIDTIEFFKKKAEETGISYQNLINLYLADCARQSRNINIAWK
jgi:predicted DNA binding CopG/RHH family protein